MTITVTISKAGALIETRIGGKYTSVLCQGPKKTLQEFTKKLMDIWNILDSEK